MQRLNVSRVSDTLMHRLPTVTASIVDHKMVSKQIAQVIVTFNTKNGHRDDFYRAVASALDNKARPISGSFREVSSYGNPAMVGFIELNREVKPYSEATAGKMRVLSSNMLMDQSDDSLWELRSDASGNKMLARQQDDDLSSLLVTASVRGGRAPKLDQVMAGIDKGEFVAFVDPVNASLRYGYVIATDLEVQPAPVGGIEVNEPGVQVVVAPEFSPPASPDNTSDEIRDPGNRVAERLAEERAPVEWNRPIGAKLNDVQAPVITVPASLIVESAQLNGSDANKEVAAPVNSQSKDAMTDYYRELYSYSPEYYSEVKKIIDDHAGF